MTQILDLTLTPGNLAAPAINMTVGETQSVTQINSLYVWLLINTNVQPIFVAISNSSSVTADPNTALPVLAGLPVKVTVGPGAKYIAAICPAGTGLLSIVPVGQ
jgi:hypothetical protein